MPSPFPGMDPYLEGDLWSSFHAAMSAEIARQLSPKLNPRYVALIQQRFVKDMSEPRGEIEIAAADEQIVYPDVSIMSGEGAAKMSACVAVAAPLRMTTVMPESVPISWVEIRDTAHRRLVTAIEVLSPVNKRGSGRRKYLRRREKLLLSTSHVMEIDLLREGRRVPMVEPLPPTPYFVFLSRAGRRPKTEVWPILLEESLPSVPVPLLNADPDALLDLQMALTAVYDSFGYRYLIDYSQSPEHRLTKQQAEWARERVRK